MQKFFPIIIPTLNRYDHLKRCVESLAANTGAELTELVIGLDYPPADKYKEGYERIKEYLPTISGFGKVTILETDVNLGPVKNTIRLQEYVRAEGYSAFIDTEDDNEFSPNFLQFANWGLNTFKDDKRISYICGFKRVNVSWLKNNVYIYPRVNAWGVATWFDRLDKERSYYDIDFLKKWINECPFSCIFSPKVTIASGVLSIIKTKYVNGDLIPSLFPENEQFCLFPKTSMVRNYGHDGSGIHGGTKSSFAYYTSLEIDKEKEFIPHIVEELYQPKLKRVYRRMYKTNWKYRGIAIIEFLIYKITGRIVQIRRSK